MIQIIFGLLLVWTGIGILTFSITILHYTYTEYLRGRLLFIKATSYLIALLPSACRGPFEIIKVKRDYWDHLTKKE